MWRLKSHLKAPPGSFCYEQNEGIRRKFECTPLIENLAHSVADFRLGNQLPRSSFAEALADIDFQNCQRLGFGERWCYSTDKTPAEIESSFIKPKSGCGTCGHPVNRK